VEYQKIKGERHYIYDHISEFYNDHPEVTPTKNWRDGDEGDWVWSDDKRIVQLLKVSTINHPQDRKNYKWAKGWLRTIVGTFLIRDNTFMDTDFNKHPNRYTFSTKIKHTSSRVKERENLTKNERIFSVNVAGGMGAVKSYMEAYEEANPDKARKRAIILLKQERIMQEVERSVLEVSKTLGLDHEYVLRKLKLLADHSEDDNIILQSTKEIGKIIGTTGVTVKQREVGVFGVFQGFSPEQLENIERQKLGDGNTNRQIDIGSDD